MTKKALGKGLQALLPSIAPSQDENVIEVTVADIRPNPYQPRKLFDPEKLEELANSIQQYGVIQPIVVRRLSAGFELVAGERRWRASQKVGLRVIPAVIRDYSDAEMMEIALIENLQREDLNPMEEATSYKRLMEEFGLTQEEVSKKLGRSRSLIANTVRLLQLPDVIQEFVSRGTISMGHAKPLLALPVIDQQIRLATQVVEEDLTVRDVEELVRTALTKKVKPPKKEKRRELSLIDAEEKLKMFFGTQVKIKPGKVKSKIEIEYYSEEDLERILENIANQKEVEFVSQAKSFVV
jgi:ParB family transcriptional regulator, chromosome partitioning protein